jgi:hypothetical protein
MGFVVSTRTGAERNICRYQAMKKANAVHKQNSRICAGDIDAPTWKMRAKRDKLKEVGAVADQKGDDVCKGGDGDGRSDLAQGESHSMVNRRDSTTTPAMNKEKRVVDTDPQQQKRANTPTKQTHIHTIPRRAPKSAVPRLRILALGFPSSQ